MPRSPECVLSFWFPIKILNSFLISLMHATYHYPPSLDFTTLIRRIFGKAYKILILIIRKFSHFCHFLALKTKHCPQ